MATLSLKISVVGSNVVKTMQFDPSTIVFDACHIIREKIADAIGNDKKPAEYGLFLADDDPKKGTWLEPSKSLEYFLLRNGDLVEYKMKHRILKVRTLDDIIKTLKVDDSCPIGMLMVTICTRLGITNHEEYSLVRELPEEEKEKTMTLKRDKSIAKDQKKLEEMRRKLHTDDDVNWLDHSKTLREQGIEHNEILLLRRKFFFSDQNVDARDPVQLQLLYVQCRDGIIDGTHPVTQTEALQFAGLQCQIQFGNYVESKHKPGFLELKEFLPKEYIKIKGIEKKIFQEHKTQNGLLDVEAKVKYTQCCRNLKTYGITFFLVKEKMKGKNKLVPRLLGITKESVVRMDEKTKEIIMTWPLTALKRWAPSPNSFTLDLGDYSNEYYSVQTTEGEQISQLISGYIDIIMRKKKAKDHLGIEGDEVSSMYEDRVTPAQAFIIKHVDSKVDHPSSGNVAIPAVIRDAMPEGGTISVGTFGRAEFGETSSPMFPGQAPVQSQSVREVILSKAQKALLTTIKEGLDNIDYARTELAKKADLPELGSDAASKKWAENELDLSKQKVTAQLSAMGAATAQLVSLTNVQEEHDATALGAAIHTISSNMNEFSHDVRMLAALQGEGSGNKLLDAAKLLAGAFSDLLNAAQPGTRGPNQNIVTAAHKVGDASHDIMKGVAEGGELDHSFQDTLLALAKAVANATAALVLKAKDVSRKCEDQALQNKVINSATQCALATSQLVACAKVVAPTISNPACRDQLFDAAKQVANSVDGIVEAAMFACKDEHLLSDLGEAATAVTKALNDLLQHVKMGTGSGEGGQNEQAVDTILTATDRLFSSVGDAHEMVKQAKMLAQATSQLVCAIRSQAESYQDTDIQKRLLAAAKQLADATAKMVEAAKGCASNPNDSSQQGNLRIAAEELRSATNAAASNALKKKLINRLENAAKQTAAASVHLISAANTAGKSNSNSVSQQHLHFECKAVSDQMSSIVQGVKATTQNPENPASQLNLINACQNFIQPCAKLIDASNAALPTVTDPSAALNLTNGVKSLSSALAELRSCTGKATDMCRYLELDSAIEELSHIDLELEDILNTARNGKLVPLPGETAESAVSLLGSTSKTVGSSMAQLLTATVQGNENHTSLAARDTANALRKFASAVRAVAATTEEKALQELIINNARDIIEKSKLLLDEAKQAVNTPKNPETQQRLAQVAKSVSNALNNCLNCLPGQRDVDNAIRGITESSQALSTSQIPETNRSYQEAQGEMNQAAVNLNQAASDIVTTSRGTPQQLASSSNRYGHAYKDFVDSGLVMAGVTKDSDTQMQIIGGLKSVSTVSSKLLVVAKSVSADPNAPNAKNLLAQAARAVTDSINQLINICTVSAPGQKECDNALRQIQMMRSLLEVPNEPVSDHSYYECLESVMQISRSLGDAMTGISNDAKKADTDGFCEAVRNFSSSINGLTEAAAQSAYLVGIADPASEPGHAGLVDQSQFARANQAIQTACQNLTYPARSHSEYYASWNSRAMVLSAATVVAKHTSALCNACRLASSMTSNPVARRHFVQAAKEVANSTANLVAAIKNLDIDFTEENRQNCAKAAVPLLKAVDELTCFASSPDFASVPAKISTEAQKAQEPITLAGMSMIDGACHMLQAAKQLAVNPKDPSTYQLYSNHSKSVSDAMKKLVSSIKDSAPGQKECDEAIKQLERIIRELDQAYMLATSQKMVDHNEKTLQGYQEQMLHCLCPIIEKVDNICNVAKSEAQNLGHMISFLTNYLGPLAEGAIGAASKMMNSKQLLSTLDFTKTVLESALQFIYACKEGGGNPKAEKAHAQIDETGTGLKDVLQDLLQMIEEAASQAGVVSNMIDSITKSMAETDLNLDVTDGKSYVDYQTSMVRLARQIASSAQDMLGKNETNISELGALANKLTRDYRQLASNSRGACMTANSPEVTNRIKTSVIELGKSCISLAQDAGSMQSNPSDEFCKRDLNAHVKEVTEKASYVLASLQSGSRGTQACINAASTVSGIIGDLNTTIMFATAGTLNTEDEENFTDHKENILKTAKALVDDTKLLVAGAASNQEQLANAAQMAVKTITQLSDVVKLGAASLGSDQPEAQVLLINAVKDVASALADLISATKNASGKNVSDPAMGSLKDSAKTMVTNVTSLLKTVKAVEDKTQRGTRALESTIEAISQELRVYQSPTPPDQKASAEDLIQYTKPITTATTKAVAAGNSGNQDDVIVAANIGRRAIFDLLNVCKAASFTGETADIRQKTQMAGCSCAMAYKEVLEHVSYALQKPSAESKQNMVSVSRNVATSVAEIVQCAEAIKAYYIQDNEEKYKTDPSALPSPDGKLGPNWVDYGDPTVIAENELRGAASSIEAAAKKLAQLQPRQAAKTADESLGFEEQILEAAKSIATATAALVKSASAAQKELILQGKVSASYSKSTLDEDGQWSQGLISAARRVAAATQSLCEAANAMVQGQASEEKLIASAKEVAGSTAALLVACKVKADVGSISMHRLQAAGNAVKKASDALVQAAQQSQSFEADEDELTINKRMVGGIAQEIMAQEEILRKEKELDSARKRLAEIRKARYKDKPPEDYDSSSSF
ncbi:talin-1-like isoform X1 [Octopus vulgaris]|uniref:Talin-1-like isoform X1 n=2 Tax=Octopus vulgaris TaxID=6645 RepID=A0AA36BZ00_OCTVU|nr:talin-1-like isoform X1 [Octopus vulgaris]